MIPFLVGPTKREIYMVSVVIISIFPEGDCDWPWLLNNGRVALSSRQAVAGSYD